jgi:hypothetical protein
MPGLRALPVALALSLCGALFAVPALAETHQQQDREKQQNQDRQLEHQPKTR